MSVCLLDQRLFTNYASQCQGQRRDQQGKSRDKQGQCRDKQGQTGTFPFCPYLSLSVPVCPCLSLLVLVCPCLSLSVPVCPCLSLYVPACPCLSMSVPVCPCLSLSVPVCLYICCTCISVPSDDHYSLHQYEHSNIDFACKSHCSNACKPFV